MACLLPLLAAILAMPPAAKYKPLPWHLVDLYWHTAQPEWAESLSADLYLPDDFDMRYYLFLVPLDGWMPHQGFYTGMQTTLTPTGRSWGPGLTIP